MNKTHALPFDHQSGCIFQHLKEETEDPVLPFNSRVISVDGPFHELPKILCFLSGCEHFKTPEAKKTGGGPHDYGSGFILRVAVVEHIAHHGFPGGDKAEGSGGGNSQI